MRFTRTLGGEELSNYNKESFYDNLDGMGAGLGLLIAGLVLTVGDIGPGTILGIPLILLGIIFPMAMTWHAQKESAHQQARSRPARESNHTYNITTKTNRQRRRDR